MVTLEFSRKQSGRQPRKKRTAIYTAPSGNEYLVEVISIDQRDNSAQIVYQWAKMKYVRAWVSVNDIEAVR